MKVIRYLGFAVSIIALIYYGYRLFGKPHGEKFEVDKHHHVYYDGDGVTENDAKKTANYFSGIGLFTSGNEMDVQISADKTTDPVTIKYVFDKKQVTPEVEQDFLKISADMAYRVFTNRNVHVVIADESLEEIKDLGTVQPKAAE